MAILNLNEFRARRLAAAQRLIIAREIESVLMPMVRSVQDCMADCGVPLLPWRAPMPPEAGETAVGFLLAPLSQMDGWQFVAGEGIRELTGVCAFFAADKAIVTRATGAHVNKALREVRLDRPFDAEIDREGPDWEMLYRQELSNALNEHVLVPARKAARRAASKAQREELR